MSKTSENFSDYLFIAADIILEGSNERITFLNIIADVILKDSHNFSLHNDQIITEG